MDGCSKEQVPFPFSKGTFPPITAQRHIGPAGFSKALTHAVDRSTQRTYGSALNSWLAFVEMHNFPIEPTVESITFYIVYMSHHISLRSVKVYLSGLVQQLEPDYPAIRQICASRLVSQVMRG